MKSGNDINTLNSKTLELMTGNIYDCRFNSMSFLLRTSGIEISPLKLLFLAQSYCLSFLKMNLPSADNVLENVPMLQVGYFNIEERLLQLLNIKYTIKQIPNNNVGEQELRNLLENGNYVLTKIDTRAGTAKSCERIDDKKALRSVASPILMDIDDCKKEAVVFWTNRNDAEPTVHIPLDVFQHCRNTVCLPFSPKNVCLYITDVSSALTEQQIDALFMVAVYDSSMATLFNTRVKHGTDFEIDVSYSSYGIHAIRDTCKEVGMYTAKYAIVPFVRISKEAILFFSLLRETLSNGCFFAYRLEYAAAISSIGLKNGDGELITIGKHFEDLSKLWFSLLTYSTKIQRGSGRGKGVMIAAHISLCRIFLRERKLYPLVQQRLAPYFKSVVNGE